MLRGRGDGEGDQTGPHHKAWEEVVDSRGGRTLTLTPAPTPHPGASPNVLAAPRSTFVVREPDDVAGAGGAEGRTAVCPVARVA